MSLHQHTPLHRLLADYRDVLPDVFDDYAKYKAHVCRQVYADTEAWSSLFPSYARGAGGQEEYLGGDPYRHGTKVPSLSDRVVAIYHGFDSPTDVVEFARSVKSEGFEFFEEPADW